MRFSVFGLPLLAIVLWRYVCDIQFFWLRSEEGSSASRWMSDGLVADVLICK